MSDKKSNIALSRHQKIAPGWHPGGLLCCYRRLSPFSHVRIRSRINPASTAISISNIACMPNTSLRISSGSPASTLYHIRQDMSIFLRKGVDILRWVWYNVSVKDISGSSLIHERSQKSPPGGDPGDFFGFTGHFRQANCGLSQRLDPLQRK